MIFNPLHESNQKGEFFGEMCHWHLCTTGKKAGQITIREIIVEASKQKLGSGKHFLERLKNIEGAISIFANCPADLPANEWYKRMGFELESQIPTKKGRPMNQWRLWL
jgi:hypothetical protein